MKPSDNRQTDSVRRFLADETAAAAVEYGLIVSGIALAITPVVNTLGSRLATTFSSITSAMR